jgi:Ni,Fe-hydrogenase I large subunit
VLGGFTYNINRNSSRQYFTADATIEDDLNNTELEAKDINENATYNWYDEDGNFISSGQTLSVTKAKLKNYKLEVIADSDGHKDYKTFTVKEDRSITSISPNPTLNDFTINYKVGTANSAFITITNVMTGVSNNYILDLSNNSKSINLSNNPSGQYIINLVTDNVIVDTKNLLKN